VIEQRYRNDLPIIAVDSETELFGFGNMAPRVVCWSFGWRDYPSNEIKTALLHREEGSDEIIRLLKGACWRACDCRSQRPL
jgi:hypothetical protein